MEDINEDPTSGQDAKGFIKEASSATDEGDDNLIYDKDRFKNTRPNGDTRPMSITGYKCKRDAGTAIRRAYF
jgi:hypothetical protein